MKKLLSALSMVLVLSFGAATQVFAGEWGIGGSAIYGAFTARGTETEGTETHSQDGAMSAEYGSLFAEYKTDGGIAIGVDWVPGTLSTQRATRTDYNEGTEANSAECDCGTNSVAVEFENVVSVYAIFPMPMINNFYLKAGLTLVDISTLESLDTGSTYGNTDTAGQMIGFGFQQDSDNVFFRAELQGTKYDSVSVTASNADNKVSVDEMYSANARISIGKYW